MDLLASAIPEIVWELLNAELGRQEMKPQPWKHQALNGIGMILLRALNTKHAETQTVADLAAHLLSRDDEWFGLLYLIGACASQDAKRGVGIGPEALLAMWADMTGTHRQRDAQGNVIQISPNILALAWWRERVRKWMAGDTTCKPTTINQQALYRMLSPREPDGYSLESI